MMMNALVRCDSMDSLGACSLSFGGGGGRGDDASWHSADAMLRLLQEDGEDGATPVIAINSMIIDISGDDDDATEGDEHEPALTALFWDDEELHCLHELSSSSLVGPSSPYGVNYSDDISSLLTGELLEGDDTPPELVDEGAAAPIAGAMIRRDDDYEDDKEEEDAWTMGKAPVSAISTPHHQEQHAQLDTIARILGFLRHTEHDRELVHKAEEIVAECQWHHQRGQKRKFQNLSGAIFERFVLLFGGPRFQEIYQNALRFDFAAANAAYLHRHHSHHHPHYYHHHSTMMAPPHTMSMEQPKTVEIAIAYGMHMARLDQMEGNSPSSSTSSSKSQKEVVQHGVEQFNSMTENERHMFWEYATRSQG